jgi:hypothetical protein
VGQMRGTGNHQCVLAILASVLWLLGVVVLPAVHEGRHARNHTHAADGTIVVDHGDHQHLAIEREHRDHSRGQLAVDHPVDPGHQAGGVAHHQVAMQHAVPPALPVAPEPIEHAGVAIGDPQITALVVPAAARGPPPARLS